MKFPLAVEKHGSGHHVVDADRRPVFPDVNPEAGEEIVRVANLGAILGETPKPGDMSVYTGDVSPMTGIIPAVGEKPSARILAIEGAYFNCTRGYMSLQASDSFGRIFECRVPYKVLLGLAGESERAKQSHAAGTCGCGYGGNGG